MSGTANEEERDMLAAEYALGLLDDAELAEARRLMLADRAFADAVERWSLALAPLGSEAPMIEPDVRIWSRIEASLDRPEQRHGPADPPRVVSLRRQLLRWQAVAAAASAIAASLLLYLAIPRDVTAPVPPPSDAIVLVASLSSDKTGASLAVAFDPAERTLLVTPGVLQGTAGRAFELWVIPSGGKPASLGLVTPGAPQRRVVPANLAEYFRNRSVIAVSVEPAGGSGTGQPTGPVIASGEFSTI